MSTQKQIDANRRNARKSTGPRTAEGKAASRLNALKSGLYANSPVIPGEDPAEYDALFRSYFDRFQPTTPEEHTLIAAIVRNAWLLERFSRLETEHWTRRLEKEADEAFPLAESSDYIHAALHILQRRIDSADRAFRRNLELLLKVQQARRTQDSGPADPAPQPARPVPKSKMASFPQTVPPAAPRAPRRPDTPTRRLPPPETGPSTTVCCLL